MYQTMVDKGFSISSIASIFSVSEESIERLLIESLGVVKCVKNI